MVDIVTRVNNVVNGFVWGPFGLALLFCTGLWLSVRTGFFQFRRMGYWLKHTIGAIFTNKDVTAHTSKEDMAISQFQSMCTALAGTIGTGNIVGVATAIVSGGPGAIFWMWIIAIIGGASAFIESTLAQIYKRRNPETGESYGGPSYYIEAALHSRPLAVIFAVALILTYAGGFNMLASYNLQSTFSGYSFYNAESTPWVIGAILAVLVGYCVMGGGKRIIKFTSTLVPFMGGLYVLVSLVVLVMNIGNLPYVFGRIFSEAFDFQAIFSGFAGSAMMYGIKRGLYSNEAGVGSAPNAAASANVSHPVKQGLVSDATPCSSTPCSSAPPPPSCCCAPAWIPPRRPPACPSCSRPWPELWVSSA
mgnify:CR=1 FL=1